MNKALIIGINDYTLSPLKGCINDMTAIASYLIDNKVFKENEIRLLANNRATTYAIKQRLEWLVADIQEGDKLFFYFSGHGAQFPSRNKYGEVDGLDEVICPYDFDWSSEKVIRDNYFVKTFARIPKDVRFIWISDSCHSGDLSDTSPYYFYKYRKNKEEPYETDGQKAKFIPQPIDIFWRTMTAEKEKIQRENPLTEKVVYLSACRSNQIARDAKFGEIYHGAFTYFLMEVLKNSSKDDNLGKIIYNARKLLNKNGFKQIPQVEGNKTLIEKTIDNIFN